MVLVARILSRIAEQVESEKRSSIDTYLTNYLLPANQFQFNGVTYPFGNTPELSAPGGLVQTDQFLRRTKELSATLPSYAAALKTCPPAFAAQVLRAMILSQARFTFRRGRDNPRGKSGSTYGTSALSLLERPWPSATTGDLISKMEWHAGLAGNAYVYRQVPLKGQSRGLPRLRVLRPDWIVQIFGSDLEPDDAALALDGELIAYVYCNGGFQKPEGKPQIILPEDMAHWFPMPDPECNSMGMSWLAPAAREMQTDKAASEHKLKFFTNGATPNLVVTGLPGVDATKFKETVEMLEESHKGLANAYRTLYLSGGADAKVVGSNFSEMDFSSITGQGETRISALSRVPAIMLGLSEGLKGAALNAGNFGQVRRMFADTWVFPQLQNLAASLAPIIDVPADSELWFDISDMPVLREDATDLADITKTQVSSIVDLVSNGGFTADSATAAVMANDMSLLKQVPGWISVQLQNMNAAAEKAKQENAPTTAPPANSSNGNQGGTPPKPSAPKNGK